MNVLGMDLSLNGPGFRPRADVVHSMTMTAKEGDRRLVRIHDAVEHYVLQYKRLTVAVIEAVPPYATSTATLERVHAAARIPLARYMVPLVYVSPTTLKVYATGRGGAEKSEMIDALPEPIRSKVRNDNEADAWWLGDMGERLCGDREEWRALPAHQIDALSKVRGAEFLRTTDPTKPVQCGHGYWCLPNGGRLLHPLLADPCDKGPKAARGRRA